MANQPNEYYLNQARALYHREGEIEIDDEPPPGLTKDRMISRGGSDNGAYVMAWVWVRDPSLKGTPT